MTDRINGFWVALGEDTRIDDAEATLAAVRQLRGVVAVESHVSSIEDWIAESRVRLEYKRKLFEVLK